MTFAAPAAFAQSTAERKAAAEALYRSARKLMAKKDYAAACVNYEKSQAMDPGIGTLLYLAECYELSGRTASAWATFSEAASMAEAAGQAGRARKGAERAERLEAGLSRLTLTVASESQALPGLVVRRGGKIVEPTIWGVAVPVDPGEYELSANADGYEGWTGKVTVGSDGTAVTAEIPGLKAEASAAPIPPPEPPSETQTPAPSEAPSATPKDLAATDSSSQATVGWVALGVGVVGLGVGSVYGLQAIGKNDDAEAFCPGGTTCTDQRGITLTDEAKDAALISNIAFGVGGLGVVAGLLLVLTAPEATATTESGRVRFSPYANRRGAGMGLWGNF